MSNTLQQLQAHLMANPIKTMRYKHGVDEYKSVAKSVVCKDGSTMSVQASELHYCTPRTDRGPWTHVEVWCIVDAPAEWDEYGGDPDPYAYIPIGLVVAEIDRRGGMV